MGNRVKGRVKKKSIKSAVHSGSSTKKKLSRMGKVQKKNHAGLDATFIGRAKVLKKLQISLKDFRRLCILKGIYPREPRGRAPKNKKGQVFYHIKDVKALAHEPLLDKFREFKSFMKKVRRSANRNEKDEARRKQPLAPKYTLHHLVRERYPRFADALGDLDDALCLVNLFACLPSDGRIQASVTRKAQLLAASWGAYCATTGSIVKSFISVKGVYLEAEIMSAGQAVPVRWVTPHNFTQHVPEGVDFRVMLTFFEFYETLLGFVLYKLYGELGVRYPLPTVASTTDNNGGDSSSNVVSSATLHPTLGGKATSVLAANLSALQMALNEASKGNSAADAVKDALQSNEGEDETTTTKEDKKKSSKASKKKQKKLMQSIDEALKGVNDDDESEGGSDDDEDNMDEDDEENVPIAAPLREALEAIDDSAAQPDNNDDSGAIQIITNPEAQKRHQLFHNLTFFLSREVPRGYLELIILSYGGNVGWEGQDSPIPMNDASITHHVIDRPKLLPSYTKLPKSREFVQPQWVLDCANFNFVLPIERYAVGSALPPHLSPWVDDKEEGYVPKYKEEIERLKNGEMLDNDDEQQPQAAVDAGASGDESLSESEEQATSAAKVLQKVDEGEGDESEDGSSESEEEEEEDDEEAELKAVKKKQTEDDEAAQLAKALMSKKAARLYGRMQHGIAQKQAKVDNLHKKRREIESTREKSKDGKTFQKLKVERLKQERKETGNAYAETGGSMKKKRRKN
jgi:pescadillo protein